jgi:hypothetical protein
MTKKEMKSFRLGSIVKVETKDSMNGVLGVVVTNSPVTTIYGRKREIRVSPMNFDWVGTITISEHGQYCTYMNTEINLTLQK